MPKRIRSLEAAGDLRDKIVLVRFDHNCVRKGLIQDDYRITRCLPTLKHIFEQGGRPILITHVNRPRDPSTGRIMCCEDDGVGAIAEVITQALRVNFVVPAIACTEVGNKGICEISVYAQRLLADLRTGRIGGIYLPNSRWFAGEEAPVRSDVRDSFARQLAGLADIFVNDAFGAWQPHASTVDVAKYLPSYAGLLMSSEIRALRSVLEPVRPFVAVVAGSKLDTKLNTLRALALRCDSLILGGMIYNAYLCAKFGINIEGVSVRDIEVAAQLLLPEVQAKLVELPFLVMRSSVKSSRQPYQWDACKSHRDQSATSKISIHELTRGSCYGAFLDIDASSFDVKNVKTTLRTANTIFANAVMGFTSDGFTQGTEALIQLIASNTRARKFVAGGDTIREFKFLEPALFSSASIDPAFFFFTGGGTVLKALEMGSVDCLETVRCLMES